MDVAELIEQIRAAGGRARGFDGATYQDPQPLAPGALAALRAPGDRELPPSLRTWLAFDARWLPLFDGDGWKETSLRDFVDDQIAEVADELAGFEEWNAEDAADAMLATLDDPDAADAPALRLPDSASQQHLLVFHPDGEPVVYGYEKEELWVKYPSFAEFLVAYFHC